MIRNYIKIALRNLVKNKVYSFINIFGLAVGIASCMLLLLYVHNELSFDKFNDKIDRIYRANEEINFGDNYMDLAVTNAHYGITAKNEIAGVEDYTRLSWYGSFLAKKGSENIREENIAWADSSLFNVFTLPLLDGNARTALSEPNSIVINESMALKYFKNIKVVGKTLLINDKEAKKITGVMKDIPQNSHFQFHAFLPYRDNPNAQDKEWAGNQNFNTYLLLKPNANVKVVEAELQKMMNRNVAGSVKKFINKSLEEFNAQGDFFKTSIIPLGDIHLHSNKTGELCGSGSLQYLYIFGAIGIFILFIACINFINLATARSTNRAKEVGIRKSLGSFKSSLIFQFLAEAVVTVAISIVIAYCLVWLLLPAFGELAGKQFLNEILYQPNTLFALISLIFLVGILAGLYPAFYLSSFNPVLVLKGNLGKMMKKSSFRNGLVVFQFVSSVVLIIGTLVIYSQLEYIRNKDIGYNREQMLIIKNTESLGKNIHSFRSEIANLSGVKNAAISGFLPVNYNRSNDSFFPTQSLDTKEALSMQEWKIDENYIPTLGMKIVLGRNFEKNRLTDSSAIIINETAATFLKNKDILAKKFYQLENEETKELKTLNIIGVVKDFHFNTLREKVKPLAFVLGKSGGSITLKIDAKESNTLLATIKTKWNAAVPQLPFEYSFMNDDFNTYYTEEQQIGKLFLVFTFLAIFIACMGLFGLATFTAEQRLKEIGIRKVLGASIANLVGLLSKDFLKLVGIAIVIAIPLSWWAMNKWLQDFAYHIDISLWIFALAGVLSIAIAILTVSFQAIKAALMNPVKSLKTE